MEKTYIYGICYHANGKMNCSRVYVNRDCFRHWCYEWFDKDEAITIEEYHLEPGAYESKLFCTWHA